MFIYYYLLLRVLTYFVDYVNLCCILFAFAGKRLTNYLFKSGAPGFENK